MTAPPASSSKPEIVSQKVFAVEDDGFKITNMVKEYRVPSTQVTPDPSKIGSMPAAKQASKRTQKVAPGETKEKPSATSAAVELPKARAKVQVRNNLGIIGLGAGLIVAAGAFIMSRHKGKGQSKQKEHKEKADEVLKEEVISTKVACDHNWKEPHASMETPKPKGFNGRLVGDVLHGSVQGHKDAKDDGQLSTPQSSQFPLTPQASSACSTPPLYEDHSTGALSQRPLSVSRKDLQRLRQQLKSRDELIMEINSRMALQTQDLEQYMLTIKALEGQIAELKLRNKELDSNNRDLAKALDEPVDVRLASTRLPKNDQALPHVKVNGRPTVEELDGLRLELRRALAEVQRLEGEKQEYVVKTEEHSKKRRDAETGAREAAAELAKVKAELEKVHRQAKGKDRMIVGYEKERVHLTAVLQELERKVDLQAKEIEAVMRLDTSAGVNEQLSADQQYRQAPASPEPTTPTLKQEDSPVAVRRVAPERSLDLMKSFDNPLSNFSPTPSPNSAGTGSATKVSMKKLGEGVPKANGGVPMVQDVSRLQEEVEQLADELASRYRLVSEKRQETRRLVEDLQRHQSLISDLQRKIDVSGHSLQEKQGRQEHEPPLSIADGNISQVLELQEKLEQVALQQRVEEHIMDINAQEVRIAELKQRVHLLVNKAMHLEGPAVQTESDVLGAELASKLAAQEQKAAEDSRELRRLSASLQLSSPYVPSAKKESLRRVLEAELQEPSGSASLPVQIHHPFVPDHPFTPPTNTTDRYASFVDTPTPVKGAPPEHSTGPTTPYSGLAQRTPPLRSPSLAYPPAPAPSAANSSAASSGGPMSPLKGSENAESTKKTSRLSLVANTTVDDKKAAEEFLEPLAEPSKPARELEAEYRLKPEGSEEQEAARWLKPAIAPLSKEAFGSKEWSQGEKGSAGDGVQPLLSPEWKMSEELDRLTREMQETQEAEDSAAVVIGSPTRSPKGKGATFSDTLHGRSHEDIMEQEGDKRNEEGTEHHSYRPVDSKRASVAGSVGEESMVLDTPSHLSPKGSQMASSPGTMDWSLDDMLNDTLDDMVRVCTPGTSAAGTPVKGSRELNGDRSGIGRRSLDSFWHR